MVRGASSLDVPCGQISVSESVSHEMVHSTRDLTGYEHQVLRGQHLRWKRSEHFLQQVAQEKHLELNFTQNSGDFTDQDTTLIRSLY